MKRLLRLCSGLDGFGNEDLMKADCGFIVVLSFFKGLEFGFGRFWRTAGQASAAKVNYGYLRTLGVKESLSYFQKVLVCFGNTLEGFLGL